MAQNVTVAGASYSDVPAVLLPKTGGGTSIFADPSGTTATAADVASGKYFLAADGTLTAGTASGGSAITIVETTDSSGGTCKNIVAVDLTGDTVDAAHLLNGYKAHAYDGTAITGTYKPPLLMGVMRPDAEVCKTWSYDFWAVADKSITIPTYSTSAKTVLASSELTNDTYTVDNSTYNYYMLQRMLTYPTYSISTKGKGRVEYAIASCAYELAEIPANTIHSLVEPTRYATVTRGLYATGAFYRSVYYSAATTLTTYSTSVYTTAQAVVAPTYSSGVITVNTPSCTMRGSTSYFVNTYWNAITDIRYQWICQLYRAPKSNLNLDGWGIQQQAQHIVDCANSNTLKLT